MPLKPHITAVTSTPSIPETKNLSDKLTIHKAAELITIGMEYANSTFNTFLSKLAKHIYEYNLSFTSKKTADKTQEIIIDTTTLYILSVLFNNNSHTKTAKKHTE